MLTELIEPGSAEWHRIETRLERAEVNGLESPVTLTARELRGLMDVTRRMDDLKDRIAQLEEDLKQEQGDKEEAERERDDAREEAARMKSQLEFLRQMKAGKP